jgi:capsid portal protein
MIHIKNIILCKGHQFANWNEIWSPPQLIAKHRTILENKQNLLFLETTNMIELKLNLNTTLSESPSQMAETKYEYKAICSFEPSELKGML